MPLLKKHQHRMIPVEGIYNLRDLGGLTAAGGKKVRKGRFFRSDSLHHLPEHSKKQLLSIGIRTVIDLRRPDELDTPHAMQTESAVGYHHIALRLVPYPEQLPFTLKELYAGIIRTNPDLLRDVFAHLFNEQESAVFHCRAGKDRTGVVAAMMLDLLGVSPETIAEDYALTGRLIGPIIPEMQAERPDFIPEDQYNQLLETHPDAILHLLDDLAQHYGGSYGYLQHIGFERHQLDGFRDSMLEA